MLMISKCGSLAQISALKSRPKQSTVQLTSLFGCLRQLMFNMPQTEFLFLVPKTYSASLLYLRYKVHSLSPPTIYYETTTKLISSAISKSLLCKPKKGVGNFTLDIPVFKPIIETIGVVFKKENSLTFPWNNFSVYKQTYFLKETNN